MTPSHQATTPRRIVVGISGASGAAYAQRLIEQLVASGIDVHLVVSPLGQRLLHDELGMEGVDIPALTAGRVTSKTENQPMSATPGETIGGGGVTVHHYRDVGAQVASGSFRHDGMIICPCSNNTLAAVAQGLSNNLLHRAANVALKERRRLILAHRETPLSLVEIRNMAAVTEAGAIIAPTNPGFYMLPERIEDLVDFVVGRLLDLVDVEHDLHTRWADSRANYRSDARRNPT